MAGYEDITYEIDEAAAVITINRPERYNAFRGKTVEELIKAFRAAWADIILTGAGDKAFCTGGDVKQRAETGDYGPTESGMFEIRYLHKLIRDVPKPVIATVNGVAVGGGHAACPVRFVDRRGERDVRLGRAASWIIRCRIRIRLFGAACRGEASAGNVVIVPSVRRGHG